MINKLFGTLCVIVFGTGLAVAQSVDNPDTTTNWGKSVLGVQMSLFMTNNSVVEAGTTITLETAIKNSSTNTIHIEYTGSASDYDPLLTSVTGKIYRLINPPLLERLNTTLPIKPGDQYIENIQVTIKKSIEPGDYALQVSRRFSVDDGFIVLKSNSIKLEIIK